MCGSSFVFVFPDVVEDPDAGKFPIWLGVRLNCSASHNQSFRIGLSWYFKAWFDLACCWNLASWATFFTILTWGAFRSVNFVDMVILLRFSFYFGILFQGSWTPADLMELLQSPQFHQQLETFTHVSDGFCWKKDETFPPVSQCHTLL